MSRRTDRRTLAVALSVSSLLASCAGTAPASLHEDRLRVLVWNVWRGGNEVEDGAEKALAVIRDAAPDLVLMQESYDIDDERPTLGRWIAAELGWNAYQDDSPHLCVLTPMRIAATFLHAGWHGVGARLVDPRGRELVAYSVWLDYRAFLGYELRDDPSMDDERLLAAESERSSRLPQARALLAYLEAEGHLDGDVPVLVGGDWNTPSHLDWTEDAARVFRRRRALPLPVSRLVHERGFTDVFRAVHPNPVQRPGITWTPMSRRPRDGEQQAFDRIDRLYLKNPAHAADRWQLRPVSATVLPEVWEHAGIPPAERVFPSDHGAVLLEFRWVRRSANPAGRHDRP